MPAYLPAPERVEIIRWYAHEYEIGACFIESGTAQGDTTFALLDEFSTVYTIEIDPGLNREAIIRFAPHPHVSCLLGDSGDLLPALVKGLTQPTIFWLDGHFCGGARGDIDTPIVEEVKAAVQAPRGSVILIDDARLFGGMPEHTEEFKDYPTVDWVRLMAIREGFDFSLQDDIMRLTPKDPPW